MTQTIDKSADNDDGSVVREMVLALLTSNHNQPSMPGLTDQRYRYLRKQIFQVFKTRHFVQYKSRENSRKLQSGTPGSPYLFDC